jgi:hypothetical protein
MDAREHALNASSLLAALDVSWRADMTDHAVDKAIEVAVAHALTALALQSTGVYEVKGD